MLWYRPRYRWYMFRRWRRPLWRPRPWRPRRPIFWGPWGCLLPALALLVLLLAVSMCSRSFVWH